MSNITPIETEYRGCRFRSRQEARFAVMFDRLDISWRYEYEGIQGNGNGYLPDFFLPELGMWVEVKGQPPTEAEFEKATMLALAHPEHWVIVTWENFDETTAGDNIQFWHDANGVMHSARGCDWLAHPEEGWQAARSARFEFGDNGRPWPRKVWPGLDWQDVCYGELPF